MCSPRSGVGDPNVQTRQRPVASDPLPTRQEGSRGDHLQSRCRRNHADGAHEGLFLRHLPDGGERADDQLYWIEPQHRGVLPLDRFHVPKRLARTVRQDKFEVRIDMRLRRGDRRLRRAPVPAVAAPGSTRASSSSIGELSRDGPLPHSGVLAGRQAGRRPLRRRAWRRVFRREHVLAGARRQQGGAGASGRRGSRMAASRCSTPSSSPTICSSSAPRRSSGPSSSACWSRQCGEPPISVDCRWMRPAPRCWRSSPPGQSKSERP